MRSALCSILIVFAVVGCAGDDSMPGDDGGGGTCEHPLDEAVIGMLTTGLLSHYDMKPGQSRQFQIGTSECCYQFNPVDACVSWSVSPTTGASIDINGNFTVDASAHNGDVFTVTANVEGDRAVVTAQVYVFTPEGNPFVGLWHEQTQLVCDGGQRTPASVINELWFSADGTVRVTWQPFELYVDYWADYTFDLGTKSFSMASVTGNYVPPDIDPMGTFMFDTDGNLVLQDMWLGTPQNDATAPACGHVFTH